MFLHVFVLVPISLFLCGPQLRFCQVVISIDNVEFVCTRIRLTFQSMLLPSERNAHVGAACCSSTEDDIDFGDLKTESL